jgi:hypothetical protein
MRQKNFIGQVKKVKRLDGINARLSGKKQIRIMKKGIEKQGLQHQKVRLGWLCVRFEKRKNCEIAVFCLW